MLISLVKFDAAAVVSTVTGLKDGRYALWHISSGPLWRVKKDGISDPVANPWRGWKEGRSGKDRTVPWFGTATTSVFWLDLYTRHRPYSPQEKARLGTVWDMRRMFGVNLLEQSGFDWIGNHFRPIGMPASPLAVRWWKRLRRWIAGSSTRLRVGRWSFWVFPSALEKLKSGMKYRANLLVDLSPALRGLE